MFVVDRIKDMIVTGGENVYSAEVENALAKHPAVAACAVIGVPDDEWGERVHAVVVLQPGADRSTLEELREHCRELIAGYKVPAQRRVRRRAADLRRRQGAQARAAAAALGQPRQVDQLASPSLHSAALTR